jgi:hypothetical protein
MLQREIRELKTGTRELRRFGLLVGGVFACLGLVFLLRGKAHYPWFLVPGLGLVLVGGVLPKALKLIYLAWMTLAILLGFIVSHVILTLFFFLVMTPIGLVARLFGKDFLRLKLQPGAETYWIPREKKGPKSAVEYEQQY